MSGTDQSGVNFTNTFPPQLLVKVEGCTSRTQAEQLEGTVATDLSNKHDQYAYSDEQ